MNHCTPTLHCKLTLTPIHTLPSFLRIDLVPEFYMNHCTSTLHYTLTLAPIHTFHFFHCVDLVSEFYMNLPPAAARLRASRIATQGGFTGGPPPGTVPCSVCAVTSCGGVEWSTRLCCPFLKLFRSALHCPAIPLSSFICSVSPRFVLPLLYLLLILILSTSLSTSFSTPFYTFSPPPSYPPPPPLSTSSLPLSCRT
jgi:hypothetical protein